MGKRVWFAAGGEILKMGPFASEVDAWDALRLSPVTQRERQAAAWRGEPEPVRGLHPSNARVWPEVRHG